MYEFTEVPNAPADLRNAYLDSLPEAQELFLEMQVVAGKTWSIENIAYATQCEDRLVELFVVPGHASDLAEIFEAAVNTSNISSVMCKSYDTQLLDAARSRPVTERPIGMLFRRIVDVSFVAREDVSIRRGTVHDAESIFAFGDDFFQSLDEIRTYAEIDDLFVLEKGGAAIGCGIGKAVVDGRSDIDIGMLVEYSQRRNGYGAHIISFLKKHYLEQDLRPICGCSIDNVGSQKALAKAGFASEHRVLEIRFE